MASDLGVHELHRHVVELLVVLPRLGRHLHAQVCQAGLGDGLLELQWARGRRHGQRQLERLASLQLDAEHPLLLLCARALVGTAAAREASQLALAVSALQLVITLGILLKPHRQGARANPGPQRLQCCRIPSQVDACRRERK